VHEVKANLAMKPMYNMLESAKGSNVIALPLVPPTHYPSRRAGEYTVQVGHWVQVSSASMTAPFRRAR